MRKFLSVFVFAILIISELYATHNRAGEISYRHLSGLTYEFTITTYTKASSVDADRDDLQIFWGDGTTSILPRTTEIILENDIKFNQYTGVHTYSGPFKYVVYVIDPNRVESILNMQNSINVPFYLEDTLNIIDPTIYGTNSSPVLLNPPIDFGNVNEIFVHNPNAYDPDGDSLSYRLIPPKQSVGFDVPGYVSPDRINPGPDNVLSINPQTGELRWETPKRQGIYNIAILVTEYRNGVMIGTVMRDLQIIIQAARNQPPVIEGKDEICAVAGEIIDELYLAEDPDTHNEIKLISNGAPYLTPNKKAQFNVLYPGNPTEAQFYWETDCSHLRNTTYQIIVKAQDNAPIPLVDIKTVQIRVNAPAPSNFEGVFDTLNERVILSWDEFYSCAGSDKFQGFSVWRKNGCGYVPDSCQTDFLSRGFVKLGETKSFTWADSTIERGYSYSYIVVAEFASKSQIGMLYNKFLGISTEEVCVKLPLDIPVFYHVDVKETDIRDGQIYIEWSKPQADALDTLLNPGPYTVRLYRVSEGNKSFLQEFTAESYSSVWDTSYMDIQLNTVSSPYSYGLEFYSAGDILMGEAAQASSVFLDIIPSNQTLQLNWSADVPWENEMYYIYLQDTNGDFEIIDSTREQQFVYRDLNNGEEYCYKIESFGSYNRDGLKYPIINFSQIICAEPGDTLPPCPPVLTVSNRCNSINLDEEGLINYLRWSFDRECEDSAAVKFNIFFRESNESDYELLDSVLGGNTRLYKHVKESTLEGCYQIEAVDEHGNVSQASNEVCAENCPDYRLPNVFTPNNDGVNDLYTPIIPYSGVTRIKMKIYNRMGNLVFETESPDIEWDGTDQKNGKALPSGTFYYMCEVFYQSLEGEVKQDKPLSGYIHLIREK